MFASSANKIERLLVLVMNPTRAELDDFLEISREIQRLDPSIAIYILSPATNLMRFRPTNGSGPR